MWQYGVVRRGGQRHVVGGQLTRERLCERLEGEAAVEDDRLEVRPRQTLEQPHELVGRREGHRACMLYACTDVVDVDVVVVVVHMHATMQRTRTRHGETRARHIFRGGGCVSCGSSNAAEGAG
jgi:hypothetical protein